MHSGPEFTSVLFVCITLGLGALARYFGNWLKLPYTIVVLLAGLAVGALLQYPGIDDAVGVVASLKTGSDIAPDLIIFVFLPALVFESAFDLDAHAFRKELGGILVFAIPALLVSTVLVGAWAFFISGLAWNWTWMTALVFGALISATDPVAVVAILRETTSPKRLSMLIEGESLMNDGTAIVIFSALVALLTSGAGEGIDVGSEVLGFFWIVGGGVAVGFLIAWTVSTLISRTFNDALIEISLTIVAAYGAMFIAEGLLHVSGVMAVVTAGLYLSGPGQSLISPEVRHFLHRFWSMVTHIANTLIFFLVGLVIASQQQNAGLVDYEIIALIFLGVVVLRFAIIFAFRPVVALVAAPLGAKETSVMAWGGLRGAVSLALALMVSQHPALPEALRQQMLLVTTGVVFLTIVVNGSTVAWLLHALGLDAQSPAEKASIFGVQASLLVDVERRLRELALRPEMAMVPWDDVHQELAALHSSVEEDRKQELSELACTTAAEQRIVQWHQTCNIERQAYWEAFSSGVLSREGIRILDHALALHFDALALGDANPPTTRLPEKTSLRLRMLNRIAKGKLLARSHFEELALRYDLARAQLVASQKVLLQMDQIHKGAEGWQPEVRDAYLGYERCAKEAIEDLRSSLPEVAHAIELRLARRIRLNLELAGYDAHKKSGAMEASVAQTYITAIETRMRALLHAPHRESLPETADVVCHLPLFQGLDAKELAELAVVTEEIALSPGQVLIKEGDASDCMYIIARGAAHVVKKSRGKEILLDTLGGGDIVGETALLTGEPRNATVVAVTTLTVGRVNRVDFERIMSSAPTLRGSVWSAFASHRFHNLVRRDWRFSHLSHEAVAAWLSSGSTLGELETGEVADPTDPETGARAHYLFVASGSVDVSGSQRRAPTLLGVEERSVYRVVEPAYVLRLGAEPSKE
jgi:Na+/H+ antiporter